MEQPNKNSAPSTSAFLAHLIWAIGGFAIWWCICTWIAITTFEPTAIPVFGARPYSQCLVFTLWGLGTVLVVLHAFVHFYRTDGDDAERFPGQIGPVVVPPSFRWMRTVLFVVIVGGTSFSYCYFVGRMFHHMSIIWAEDKNANPVQFGPAKDSYLPPKLPVKQWLHTRSGAKMLLPPFRPGGPFASGWRWYSWQDGRDRDPYKVADAHDPTGSTVSTSAMPGVEPPLFLALAIGFAISSVLAMTKPLPKGRQQTLDLGI